MFLKFGTSCIVFLSPFHVIYIKISFHDIIPLKDYFLDLIAFRKYFRYTLRKQKFPCVYCYLEVDFHLTPLDLLLFHCPWNFMSTKKYFGKKSLVANMVFCLQRTSCWASRAGQWGKFACTRWCSTAGNDGMSDYPTFR